MFGTANQLTLAVSGTGSAGMEACVANLTEPGDEAIVCVAGVFGARMADVAERYGATVHTVEADGERRSTPTRWRRRWLRTRARSVVGIVHAETSTGAHQPLEEISRIVHAAGALLLVDAVTSLGGHELRVDDWRIDACYSGTQKCLSCPPGLAPVTFSAAALEAMDRRKTKCRSWYLDMSLIRNYWSADRAYHHTAPVNMTYALREALRAVLEEGLEPHRPPPPEPPGPNILVLFGDDIGMWNISYFSRGQMGYRTPNIDRVANEGVAFTDYYGQQSCTAGRAAFITGQNPVRTGLTKVGMPGATIGLQAEDPTIAELLKPLGYATGQFGKNHLGDRDEYLPTVHGFDEFFGNLYHLNAEEEPELPDYPKDPAFKKKFGPRGVLHCTSDGKGGQKIKDTGPLTKKRMETIDEEITEKALDWMEKQAKAEQPFFLWYNSTAMHFRTHVAEKNLGKSGQDEYSDRMVTHDEQIGQILDKLDELGIADNTIVMYSTDNGPENDTWPDAANTPFRSQKDTNWEGGWRVPAFIRWPGKIEPGTVLNGIVSHQDMLPTFLAIAGDPDVSQKLLKGYKVGDKTFKVHIDGYNMVPYLTGQEKESPRKFFFYMSDDGGGHGGPQRRLEDGGRRAARGADAGLDGAAQQAAGPAHLQSASRPVRAGPAQLQHLLRLDDESRLHALRDAGAGGGADRGLREVPAAPETGLVQPGRGHATGAGPPSVGRTPRLSRRGCGRSTSAIRIPLPSTAWRSTGVSGRTARGAVRTTICSGRAGPTARTTPS